MQMAYGFLVANEADVERVMRFEVRALHPQEDGDRARLQRLFAAPATKRMLAPHRVTVGTPEGVLIVPGRDVQTLPKSAWDEDGNAHGIELSCFGAMSHDEVPALVDHSVHVEKGSVSEVSVRMVPREVRHMFVIVEPRGDMEMCVVQVTQSSAERELCSFPITFVKPFSHLPREVR
jgi:hypothetical protein